MKRLSGIFASLLFVVLTTIASLTVSQTVQAQTLPDAYSAEARTIYIDLARAGDAEAYYQLGLMHLHGLGASKNETVARSFFAYASKGGHQNAQAELAALPVRVIKSRPSLTPKVKTRPATAETEIVKSKNVAGSTTMPSDTKLTLEVKQAAAKKRAELAAKRKAEKQAALKIKRQQARKARQANIAKQKKLQAEQKQARLAAQNEEAAMLKNEASRQNTALVTTSSKTTQKVAPITNAQANSQPTDFAAIMKGIITALLLILMFVAMVAMGRRIQN